MSLAVNSYLIPIQLCRGKKTKYHRYICIYGISVFLPFFNANSRYCYYRIRGFSVISILVKHPYGSAYFITTSSVH